MEFIYLLFYVVNGKEYKVVGPEYKAYKIMTKNSPISKNEIEYKEGTQILQLFFELNGSFVDFFLFFSHTTYER